MNCNWQEVTKELQIYCKEKRYNVWNSEQRNYSETLAYVQIYYVSNL